MLLANVPSQKPQCFDGRSSDEFGLHYRGHRKARMNIRLFCEWLYAFDEYVSRTPGGRVALLLDKCSGHGKINTLPLSPHGRVLFLPNYTTSLSQPLYYGVIATVKQIFKWKVIVRVVDLIEMVITQNLYDLDVRTAVENIY